jgi:hypothetical protein
LHDCEHMPVRRINVMYCNVKPKVHLSTESIVGIVAVAVVVVVVAIVAVVAVVAAAAVVVVVVVPVAGQALLA